MDASYDKLDLPFELALACRATVVSRNGTRAVVDAGLKALSAEYGVPARLAPGDRGARPRRRARDARVAPEHPLAVGDAILLIPAHVDPTVNLHGALHAVEEDGACGAGRSTRAGLRRAARARGRRPQARSRRPGAGATSPPNGSSRRPAGLVDDHRRGDLERSRSARRGRRWPLSTRASPAPGRAWRPTPAPSSSTGRRRPFPRCGAVTITLPTPATGTSPPPASTSAATSQTAAIRRPSASRSVT